MAALWLTVVMPVISRTLPSSSLPDLGWCGSHGLSISSAPLPTDPASPTDHCGYCGLLGHSPLLPGGLVAMVQPPSLAASVSPARRERRAGVEPVLSANPRGPPSLPHG